MLPPQLPGDQKEKRRPICLPSGCLGVGAWEGVRHLRTCWDPAFLNVNHGQDAIFCCFIYFLYSKLISYLFYTY